MTSRRAAASEATMVPAVLGERGCNITFVVDTSEKMAVALEPVKRLLVQTLLTKALLGDSLFNIMAFSGEVSCWSNHMLPCTAGAVYTALPWIRSMSCGPGRDLLAALGVALADPLCQAVHLLSTDLHDRPGPLLRVLPALAGGRPVNIFCLLDSAGQLDGSARDYLQCLTHSTRGRCFIINVTPSGELDKLIALYAAESKSTAPGGGGPPGERCSSSTSIAIPRHRDASSPPLGRSLASPPAPRAPPGQTPAGSEFFPGCRVLARRETDGFYHLGAVVEQVQAGGGAWVVEFDAPGGAGRGVASSQRHQLVCSLDMVKRSRAHTPCLANGDAVLAPLGPDLRRYGPGRVMTATGNRGGFGADASGRLRVLMWNGRVSLVPDSLALPISSPRHDRIVRELRAAAPAPGHRLVARFGAGLSSRTAGLLCPDYSQPACCCSCSLTSRRRRELSQSQGSSFERRDGFDGKEEEEEVDTGIAGVGKGDADAPSSSSSHLSEDGSRVRSPPEVRPRSEQQRPPWRYWRRTGAEPQHRQPASAVPRRPSPPARCNLPVPQTGASPNHSSLFKSLPGATGRGEHVGDVFGTTRFKPRPPVGLLSPPGDSAAIYT